MAGQIQLFDSYNSNNKIFSLLYTIYHIFLFCYLGDTSGINLFQTTLRSIKILDRFQVNTKLQKSETNIYVIP